MNRREFLRTSVGAGAFALAGSAFGGLPGPASDRIRVALVGCRKGGRGMALMSALLKCRNVEVACVCDPDLRAMDFAAATLACDGYATPVKEKDFRKVLEMRDVDAVVSATPDHFHAYSAIMAMRAGKAVYVEKPCAYCPAELETILRTWRETGAVFQMGSQRRSAPSYLQAVAEIREQGLIGVPRYAKCWYNTCRAPVAKGAVTDAPAWLDWDLWQSCAPREQFRENVVHYNWHWFRKWGTGECGNNQVHFTDVVRWCLGGDYPDTVVSTGGKYFMPEDSAWEWPDTQMMAYTYPDGRFVTWEGTSGSQGLAKHAFMGFGTAAMVFGTEGSALFCPGGAVLVYDRDGVQVREMTSDGKPAASQITNTNDRSGAGWSDSTPAHFENFFQAIRERNQRLCRANAEIAVKSTYLPLVGNIAQLTGELLKVDPATGRLLGASAAARNLWGREYAKGWEVA
ncbi:MAG: Gfo/Idh/MocA family protein [Kiritimatiellia bacterium]